MLFIYIHTHPVEKCLIEKPEEIGKVYAQVQEAANKAGIKTTGLYAAAHEHTIFGIFETDDVVALERALIPLTTWGTARLIPITTVGQVTGR